jgi:hypothetical protein
LAFLFAAAALYPQDELWASPLNPQTCPVFLDICGKLSERPLVKGNFEQTKAIAGLSGQTGQTGQARSLKSRGNFVIAQGYGMIWETLSPFPSTLAAGKDRVVQQRPGGRRVTLEAAGNETFLRFADVIAAVFSGNPQRLTENFDVFFTGNAASWNLGLIPLEKAIKVFAERIVMKGDGVIRYVNVAESSGGSVLYLLSNHSYPVELTADEKAFFIP